MSDFARKQKAAAWAVHIFTASGAVLGFFAMAAIFQGDQELAFFWMGMALLVDGVDGTLARRARVHEVTPQVDGTTLDNVIDYFNYVIVPALMVYWFGLVPEGWETWIAAGILAVSCYTFANAGMKTDDYYFVGFPALWNLLVLYFYILQSSPLTNLIIIIACMVLTFVPLKYVHPFRVRDWRRTTLLATLIWAGSTLALAMRNPVENPSRETAPTLFWVWAGVSAYFGAVSLWRSIRPAPDA